MKENIGTDKSINDGEEVVVFNHDNQVHEINKYGRAHVLLGTPNLANKGRHPCESNQVREGARKEVWDRGWQNNLHTDDSKRKSQLRSERKRCGHHSMPRHDK